MGKITQGIKIKLSREKHKFEKIEKLLELVKRESLYPSFDVFDSCGTNPEVQIDGKKVLMFSSNNYLGLATNPKVVKSAQEQLLKHGCGPGGSRFLCGNIDILEELDKKVASIVGKEDAITFPTGYMANLAVFNAVMDTFMAGLPYSNGSGVIFSDEYNHATIIDGCRMSTSKKVIFKHNDMNDLKKKISKYPKNKHKMIVTEGVFSLDGHLGRLKEVAEIAKKYNAIFMVDDAHGIGVLGNEGGGTPQVLGVTKDIDILMGSFDKTIGSMGGYLAGKKELIEYFRIAARPYIFSSAMPGALAGGALSSLNICSSSEGQKLRERLMENSHYLRRKLEKVGYTVYGDGAISVLAVLIGDENKSIKFSDALLKEGIFIPCFRWPAVPEGTARARVTVMATHTEAQLDKVAEEFYKIGKELKII